MQKLKVLISAYACEPYRGSEPAVGWNWVKQIARFHSVWVITRVNNRHTIEQALAKEPMPHVHWCYFDLPRWARFWKKGQRGVHLYYYLWQIGAYFVSKNLHKQVGFELVHHITFGVYWLPSFLALLPVSFIWGPVGGGDSAPRVFYQDFGLRSLIVEQLRDFVNLIVVFAPWVRLTARKSVLALANTEQTKEKLQKLGCRNTTIYSHMGVSTNEIRMYPVSHKNVFRLVSIGRLVHWKGFHLALKAFARFHKVFPASEYWIIGDGPAWRNIKVLTNRLHLEHRVRFLGGLPHRQVLEKLLECDVLIHPSLHDSDPAVCLEAMAAGCPVICLDLGGPAFQVTKETGVKVPAIFPGQTVRDLAEVIHRLAENPELRTRMGRAARKRVVEYFDWSKKGERIEEIYKSLIGQYS